MNKKIGLVSLVILLSLSYCAVLGCIFRYTVSERVFGQDEEKRKVLIVMYHSVLKSGAKAGKYIVTTDTLESDIKYLTENNYTIVSAQDIIDYCENGASLPFKSVLLTFDDGHYNFYTYVMPILKKYNINAVCSPVSSYTDKYKEDEVKNPNYDYLGWSDIYDMFMSSNVEVGNHSYDFHSYDHGRNGSKKRKYEGLHRYERIFKEDTEKAQNRFMAETGFEPIIYTYPFGAYTEETTEYLKDMGFKMSLSCSEGINTITRDSDSLFLLKRYNRPSGISSADFFARITKKQTAIPRR